MITAGYLKGQYFKKPGENPSARPSPQNNGMLETQGENPNVLLDYDLMKTFVRKVIKLGCCQHCWYPEPHGPREICLYKGVCKQCCAVLKNLTFKGFHHSCQSLITALTDHRKVKTNPQLKRRAPEMGEPTDPTQLVYTQSSSEAKRVKLMAELKKKKTAREAAEKKEDDKKAAYEEAQKKAAAALEEAMAMERKTSVANVGLQTTCGEPRSSGSTANPKGGKRADLKSTPQPRAAAAAQKTPPPQPIEAPALSIGAPNNQSAAGPPHPGGVSGAGGEKRSSHLNAANASSGPARAGGMSAPPPSTRSA